MEKTNLVYSTVSKSIVNDQGKLTSLIINISAAAATLKVYDGKNASGQLIIDLAFPAADSKSFDFANGIPFYNGLYIEINANIASYIVVYTIG